MHMSVIHGSTPRSRSPFRSSRAAIDQLEPTLGDIEEQIAKMTPPEPNQPPAADSPTSAPAEITRRKLVRLPLATMTCVMRHTEFIAIAAVCAWARPFILIWPCDPTSEQRLGPTQPRCPTLLGR
jgi:hypothetical protein